VKFVSPPTILPTFFMFMSRSRARAGPRPELALIDFTVSSEAIRLMGHLDKMKVGTIRRVEVRAGIPRRILLESHGIALGVSAGANHRLK
jgi:hypothetical protein